METKKRVSSPIEVMLINESIFPKKVELFSPGRKKPTGNDDLIKTNASMPEYSQVQSIFSAGKSTKIGLIYMQIIAAPYGKPPQQTFEELKFESFGWTEKGETVTRFFIVDKNSKQWKIMLEKNYDALEQYQMFGISVDAGITITIPGLTAIDFSFYPISEKIRFTEHEYADPGMPDAPEPSDPEQRSPTDPGAGKQQPET